MNRRNFLGALMGFAVLPSATTYKRIWKAAESGLYRSIVVDESNYIFYPHVIGADWNVVEFTTPCPNDIIGVALEDSKVGIPLGILGLWRNTRSAIER